jgi:hypothetical protein
VHLEAPPGGITIYANGIDYDIDLTAHIDLYNPNGGLAGLLMHGLTDVAWGTLMQALGRGNIDPKNCPW